MVNQDHITQAIMNAMAENGQDQNVPSFEEIAGIILSGTFTAIGRIAIEMGFNPNTAIEDIVGQLYNQFCKNGN